MRFPPSTSKASLAGPPARRAAYYSLAQTAYGCLAGSFEMPMALRLAGSLEYVALVYAFFYTLVVLGFALGLVLVREGRASLVFRLELSLLAALALGSAAFFPRLVGLPVLALYFALRGLAEGLYWAARHRTQLWAVRDAGRDAFALKLQSFAVALGVLLPLLSGAVVSFLGPRLSRGNPLLPSGYLSVFLLTGLVLLAILALSPSLRIGRSPLVPSKLLSLARLPEAASWRLFLAIIGFAGVAAAVGSGILTFGVLKTEFRIGALNAAIALLSALFFWGLRRALKGRKGGRLGGVLAGALADFCSRLVYALFPSSGGLALKSSLDAFAVPLKSLLGENVQRAHLERLSTLSGASVAELYLFQESMLWGARMLGCGLFGFGIPLAIALGGPAGAEAAVRLLLALAAPAALFEFLLLRSFVRAGAARSGPPIDPGPSFRL